LLLTISFLLRHQLSGLAMRDLIDLLNAMVPGCLPKTKYYIDKLLNVSHAIICHIYCKVCLGYIGLYTKGAVQTVCGGCTNVVNYDVHLKTGCFFVMLPLELQLRELLERSEIQDALFCNRGLDDGLFKDVCDGLSYRKHPDLQPGTNNISTVWNTDGVPVFESSNYSIWPVYHMINELPYRLRARNTVLHALWFGNQKPRMDTFLKPFVDDGIHLYNSGVKWFHQRSNTVKLSKVLFLICSCDSVARAPLQNIKQFNGEHGCSFCLHKGVIAAKGDGHTRVYPFEEQLTVLRTHESMVANAEQAVISGEAIYGVKGPSVLMLLPKFDVAKSFVPDYMHAVLLGVVRSFMFLWFDSSSSKYEFYLGREKEKIDGVLLNIKPTTDVKRLPRSVESRKFWKASEWRNFLLFYSPIALRNVLPSKFYDHWMLLVFAINTLLSCPSFDDVTKVDLALHKFVVLVGVLYGVQYTSFNVHLLTHISTAVKNWGPLWAHSNFIFENNNGMLLKLFNGTQAVPKQICKTFLKLRIAKSVYETNAHMLSETVCLLLDQNFNCTPNHTNLATFGLAKCLGTSLTCNLTRQELFAIENYTQSRFPHCIVKSFQRAIVHGAILSCEAYAAKFGRNDSYIILDNGVMGAIVKIYVFACHADQCACPSDPFLIVVKYETEPEVRNADVYVGNNLSIALHKVHKTHAMMACTLNAVRQKMLAVHNLIDESLFLIEPPNCFLE
jgi:hypothetical protein